MRIRVSGIAGISDLANDCDQIAATARYRGNVVVRRNIERGNKIAQGIAQKAAGVHGEDYHKRLTAEMTGLLEGEYGPEGPPKTDYVGVDGAEGAMRDLNKSAEKIAPRFQRDVSRMLDGLFWP